MVSRVFTLFLTGLMSLAAVEAADIEGNIVIKRRLTKRRVTTPANSYDRGVSVELRSDTETDPLATERTRVVIYLEGQGASTPVMQLWNRRTGGSFRKRWLCLWARRCRFLTTTRSSTTSSRCPIPKSFDLGNYPKGHTRYCNLFETWHYFCQLPSPPEHVGRDRS